ncbi:MAG: RluA family pseudouridine synthase [Clostridiales bacterium]|nr:RluA family pseudouridine synthase [Clostridiales bacterium]
MTPLLLTAVRTGQRADQFLAETVEGLTRSAAQRLLEQGAVTADGKPLKKNDRLEAGTVLRVELPEPEPLDVQPQDIPLDVVYEDGDVIVVNKPVGMVVHPAPGHPDGTLVNALLYHCGDSLSGINGQLRPGIVHRIDRDTSGLIIAAKNDAAHLALSQQLQDHSLARTYEAIAVGSLREDAGTVNAPIARHRTDRKRMAVDPAGRPAVTHWQVLDRSKGCTYLRCRLETGRTHQIRVHLVSVGHPLLGDTVYGAKKPVPGLAGQCLHARALTFRHPTTGETVHLTCPLPDWFVAQLRRLELEPAPLSEDPKS